MSQQLTIFPGPPDLTEGKGKEKIGQPKTYIGVAARGRREGDTSSLNSHWYVPGLTRCQMVGYAVLSTSNAQQGQGEAMSVTRVTQPRKEQN